jgi:hypothetical protein
VAEVRRLIVDGYGNDDFTDTRINTGFVVLGWLVSGGDFERGILVTNGCGGDTDSSTASLAALMAIIDPDSIPDRWLAPIGDDLVLNAEVVGIDAPATVHGFTDLVVALREDLAGVWPQVAPEPEFDPRDHEIPVTVDWSSPFGLPWGRRDAVGLPPERAPMPELSAAARRRTVPGTWVRWPREDFEDRVLILEYTLHLDHEVDGRLMFNCSEHLRVWLDGAYLFGSGPAALFPTQHRPPAAQGADVRLVAGRHTLRAAILRPPAGRDHAEWVVGLAEHPVLEWVPSAFRPPAGA